MILGFDARWERCRVFESFLNWLVVKVGTSTGRPADLPGAVGE
jgi:hypothetical protein